MINAQEKLEEIKKDKQELQQLSDQLSAAIARLNYKLQYLINILE